MISLSRAIKDWIEQSNGWFSYWQLDKAVGIETPKQKTLRRVVINQLYSRNLLIKHPIHKGVYKKFFPLKPIDWQR